MKKLKNMPEKDFYQISLKLIIRNNKNEVLVLKDQNSGTFAGFYDLPGGRIDDNEFSVGFMDILKRELTEEIGDVKILVHNKPVALGRALSQRINNIRVIYIFFEAEYKSGEIVINEEHTAYKWVKLEEIKLEEYFTSGILEGIKMYLDL